VLFAMIVYGIVGIALSALIHWLTDKQLPLQRKRALAEAAEAQAAPQPTDRPSVTA
jgi:hypothetical protein